jgi:hypothetical protein
MAQISAQYNSSPSMSDARFRKPRLPQQNVPKATSQPISHVSFFGPGQFASPLQDQSQDSTMSAGSMYQNGHGSYQQQLSPSLSPSFGSMGFGYGYQQAHQEPMHNYYMHSPKTSMYSSMASTYYGSTSSSTPDSSIYYGPMLIDQQGHTNHKASPSTPTSKPTHDNYSSYENECQQLVQRQSKIDLQTCFEQYKTQTKEIFTLVKDCQLEPTANILLQISRFLIGNVAALGLDRDDVSQYKNRLQLWDTFNQCWLTVLQMQYKTTQRMHCSGRGGQQQQNQLPPTHSVLDMNTLESLGQELVKLCDGIEKVGLVDYQMGVAEERIIERKSFFLFPLSFLVFLQDEKRNRKEIV